MFEALAERPSAVALPPVAEAFGPKQVALSPVAVQFSVVRADVEIVERARVPSLLAVTNPVPDPERLATVVVVVAVPSTI